MASQLKDRDPNARDDPQLVAPLAEEPKAQRLKVLRTRSVCATDSSRSSVLECPPLALQRIHYMWEAAQASAEKNPKLSAFYL